MPDSNGKLSEVEIKSALETFRKWEVEKLGGDLVCEVCKNTYWGLHGHILGRKSDHMDTQHRYWRLPSIAFVCSECGNTKTFIAYKMGITPWGLEEDSPEEQPDGS